MHDQHTRITIYDYLLCDHIETCESRRLVKSRKFIRHIHSMATEDELRALARFYNINQLIHDIVKGLAFSVGSQISKGINLSPFNPTRVISGILNFDYSTIIDPDAQAIEPIDTDAYGEFCFKSFIECMERVRIHSDYTLIAYEAFEYAYQKYLQRSPEAFADLPEHQRYLFLGPWALSLDDIEPYMRAIFMIIALIVDHPRNFEDYYGYYLDSIWDYHHEKTGRLLIDRKLISPRTLTRAFQNERIFELCPVLTQPQHSDILYYFRQHSYEVAHQLMCAQLRDALYLTS